MDNINLYIDQMGHICILSHRTGNSEGCHVNGNTKLVPEISDVSEVVGIYHAIAIRRGLKALQTIC